MSRLNPKSCDPLHFYKTSLTDYEKIREKGHTIWGLLLNNVAYLRPEFLTKTVKWFVAFGLDKNE